MRTADTNLIAPASRNETALLISSIEHDHQTLSGLFYEQNWDLYSAHSLGSASTMLHRSEVFAIITERDVSGGSWKDVLEMAQVLPTPPLVIVTSLNADEYLWAEALNLGAYDVVAKPFNTKELLRVFGSVWRRQEPAFQGKSMAVVA